MGGDLDLILIMQIVLYITGSMTHAFQLQRVFTTEMANINQPFEILYINSNFSLILILVIVYSLVGRQGLGKHLSLYLPLVVLLSTRKITAVPNFRNVF